MNTIPDLQSACCGQPCTLGGYGLTHYYVCTHCGQATDGEPLEPQLPQEAKAAQEINYWRHRIATMTHAEMASLWRYAPIGHPVFDNRKPLFVIFKARYDSFGGMTPELSKTITP